VDLQVLKNCALEVLALILTLQHKGIQPHAVARFHVNCHRVSGGTLR
jgi:hypothetical protein